MALTHRAALPGCSVSGMRARRCKAEVICCGTRQNHTLALAHHSPRYEQFHAESEVIIPTVASAFAGCGENLRVTLSREVERSHALTSSHLRNTLPETDWLPACARRLGAVAASAFGAGFGGSVWALVAAEEASSFREAWSREYTSAYPDRQQYARFFVMDAPAPGAFSVTA